jgi:hypothetical protein
MDHSITGDVVVTGSLPKYALDGQFVLTQDPAFIPVGWRVRQKDAWMLATHASLPVAEAHLANGAWIGWLIGYPIDPDQGLCPPGVVFPAEAAEDGDALEATLYRMGGRYAGIFFTPAYARLYLDAGGTLPVVYSSIKPVVASTPSLIDDSDHAWDEELIGDLGMPGSGLWYPSGLTPRHHVARLLPNHLLDLASLQPARHWPPGPEFLVSGGSKEHVATIAGALRQNIAAVARSYPLHLSLTAGRDSRMLLACAREHTANIRFFTFTTYRETADSHIARAIAKAIGLDLALVGVERADEAQLAEWLDRTGCCVSGDIWKTHPTLQRLDGNRALLPGAAGEVGRAYYWRATDTPATRLDARDLLRRCDLPTSEEIVRSTAAWLDGLAEYNVFTVLDLLYIEQRLGCWSSLQQHGSDHMFVCQLIPFAQRDIFHAMLSLPVEYRRRQQLAVDICALGWPELLNFPFNDFSGIYKYPVRLARYAKVAGRRLMSALRGGG